MSENIKYIGASDHNLDLFESQYPVPEGMAYNSYVIMDEQIAVMDTVDASVANRWKERLAETLGGRKPNYLVVQHLEPDHSALIGWFAEQYPEAEIVLSARAAQMLPQFFGGVTFRTKVVKEGDTLSLGNHELQFLMAPMVHWPEVMVSYEKSTRSLFSADAFGEFGANEDGEDDDEWAPGARRYYYNICGKYAGPVQTLLQKAKKVAIETVYPLHGPILRGEMLSEALAHYENWSTYTPEQKGVLVAYASIHGNTAAAAEVLASKLRAMGQEVMTLDLCRTHVSESLSQAMDHEKLVLAASSYDAGLFPPMEDLLLHLKAKGFCKRSVALVENGSWAPSAGKVMRKMLEEMKEVTIVEPMVTIKSTLNAESEAQMDEMVKAICQ